MVAPFSPTVAHSQTHVVDQAGLTCCGDQAFNTFASQLNGGNCGGVAIRAPPSPVGFAHGHKITVRAWIFVPGLMVAEPGIHYLGPFGRKHLSKDDRGGTERRPVFAILSGGAGAAAPAECHLPVAARLYGTDLEQAPQRALGETPPPTLPGLTLVMKVSAPPEATRYPFSRQLRLAPGNSGVVQQQVMDVSPKVSTVCPGGCREQVDQQRISAAVVGHEIRPAHTLIPPPEKSSYLTIGSQNCSDRAR